MLHGWKRSYTRRRGAACALVVGACALLAVTANAGLERATAGPAYKKAGSWGKTGASNGQFLANAYGLAVARSGDVYVADSDNRRVQVFSAKGAFKRSYPTGADEVPQDVATDSSGSAWVAVLQAAEARRIVGGSQSVATGQEAFGIAVDADGNLWVAASGDNTHRLVRYDKASGYAEGTSIGGLGEPRDVEASPDGSVYVVDGLNVKRFVNGKLVKTIKAGVSKPIGIGVDLDCNLWITNISQRNLTRVKPTGRHLGTVT